MRDDLGARHVVAVGDEAQAFHAAAEARPGGVLVHAVADIDAAQADIVGQRGGCQPDGRGERGRGQQGGSFHCLLLFPMVPRATTPHGFVAAHSGRQHVLNMKRAWWFRSYWRNRQRPGGQSAAKRAKDSRWRIWKIGFALSQLKLILRSLAPPEGRSTAVIRLAFKGGIASIWVWPSRRKSSALLQLASLSTGIRPMLLTVWGRLTGTEPLPLLLSLLSLCHPWVSLLSRLTTMCTSVV